MILKSKEKGQQENAAIGLLLICPILGSICIGMQYGFLTGMATFFFSMMYIILNSLLEENHDPR